MTYLENSVEFALDHFGVASSEHIRALRDFSTSNRERKRAFNTLLKLAQLSRQLPTGMIVTHISLRCDASGQLKLCYHFDATKREVPAHV